MEISKEIKAKWKIKVTYILTQFYRRPKLKRSTSTVFLAIAKLFYIEIFKQVHFSHFTQFIILYQPWRWFEEI